MERSLAASPSKGPLLRCGLWLAAVGAVSSWPSPSSAAEHRLSVRIIQASRIGTDIDDKLKDLAKDLAVLKFTSFKLKDQAVFKLEPGARGRMQLPGREWMTVVVRGLTADGKLRIEIAVKKLSFKTIVAVAPGATVAIRGPSFEGDTLILAVKRS